MGLIQRVAAISPFGPVFAKELRVASRRKRTYVLRSAYLGVLFVGLLVVWSEYRPDIDPYNALVRTTLQNRLAIEFFETFAVICTITMAVIGPVLTANALGAERLAKTLPILLITPISAWQIVGGKLASRTLPAMTLIGLSLPALAVVRLLGGVEIEQMIAALAIAVSVLFACAAVGLLFSLFLNRPAAVVVLSYIFLATLYIVLPVTTQMLAPLAGSGGPGSLVEAVHPAAVISEIVRGDSYSYRPGGSGRQSFHWLPCVAWHLGAAALLLTFTALRVRRLSEVIPAEPQPFLQKSKRARVKSTLNKGETIVVLDGARLSAADSIEDHPANDPVPVTLGPTSANPTTGRSDAATSEWPPVETSTAAPAGRTVWNDPILWRELQRPLLRYDWQRLIAIYGVFVVLGLFDAGLTASNAIGQVRTQSLFSTTFFGIWCLVGSILSATAIAQEKESDTWNLLLTTPLTGGQIVFAKTLGVYTRMAVPTLVMIGHMFAFAVTGVIPYWTCWFTLVVMLTCNSVFVASGIYLSLVLRRTLFAIGLNLLLSLAVYGIIYPLLAIPDRVLGADGEIALLPTNWNPFVHLAALFLSLPHGNVHLWDAGMHALTMGKFIGGAALMCCGHLAVAVAIWCYTARRFDAIVDRAGKTTLLAVRDTAGSILPPAGLQSPPAARFLPRATALLIDLGLVAFALMVAGSIVGLVRAGRLDFVPRNSNIRWEVFGGAVWAALWWSPIVWCVYASWMEAGRSRATLGKRLVGLVVSRTDGRRLALGQAFKRNVCKLAGVGLAGLGCLSALVNAQRKTFHDDVAGTLCLRN